MSQCNVNMLTIVLLNLLMSYKIYIIDDDLVYFVKMREDYEQSFRTIIKSGIANGDIKNLNVEVIVFSILSTLRTLYLWYGIKIIDKPSVLKSSMIQVLLNGII